MLNKDNTDKMNSISWWHRIKIENEITPGKNFDSDETFLKISKFIDFKDKTVLDIGCWDGFYSFKAEQSGAKKVVATDYFVWDVPEITDAGFDFAHSKLNSDVVKIKSKVEDLLVNVNDKFDVVLMLGVLYHAKNPIMYMEIAKELSKDIVVFETVIDLQHVDVPAIRYYIGDEFHNDPTNYWGFNPKAFIGMLKDVGFSEVVPVALENLNRMIFIASIK